MADFSALYPRIRMTCASVPEMVMKQAVIDAVRRLCTRGWCYKEVVADIAVTAGTSEYDIELTVATEEVVSPMSAFWQDADGNEWAIEPCSEEELDRARPNWRLSEGTPAAFTVETIGKIRLAPIPSSDGVLSKLRVIKRPPLSMTAVPDYLYDNWADELVIGAQSQILMMPKRPWSNYTLGYRFHKDFNALCAEVRREERRGNTPTNLQIRIPRIT